MTRKTTLTVFMLTACVLGFAVVARSGDPQKRVDPVGFKPVASIAGIMNGQKAVFTELGNTIRNPNAKEREERIEGLSEALAELANVNQYNSDKPDFQNWAKQLRDTSLQLSAEAKKEKLDEAKIKELAGSLKNTCSACHDKYQ